MFDNIENLMEQFKGKSQLEILYSIRGTIDEAIKKVKEHEQHNSSDTGKSKQ